MAIALSGDAKIYYEVHGAGPAVLFVHGSGGHHAAWWQQVAALSSSYTVITVDLRGFGIGEHGIFLCIFNILCSVMLYMDVVNAVCIVAGEAIRSAKCVKYAYCALYAICV